MKKSKKKLGNCKNGFVIIKKNYTFEVPSKPSFALSASNAQNRSNLVY